MIIDQYDHQHDHDVHHFDHQDCHHCHQSQRREKQINGLDGG